MDSSAYEKALRSQLSSLDRSACVAFAASCAERLFGAVTAWQDQGNAQRVRKALNVAWQFASGRASQHDLASLIKELEQSLTSEDAEGFSESDARVQDSIAGAIHTLRQIDASDVEHAVWAARQVLDALDRQAQARLGPGLYDSTREQLLTRDPSLVDEQSRQLRDMKALVNRHLSAEIADTLRTRATEEGASLLSRQGP